MIRNNYSVLLLFVALASCTGTLTDEQRKKIRQNMEQGSIRKVSEAQITEAAFQYGRSIIAALESNDAHPAQPDSLAKAYQVEIISLQADNPNLRAIERQLLEAYSTGNSADDNVQKMGMDSLLYTKPILQERNGTKEFVRAIGIRMTRKQIVLSIKQ